MNKSNSALVLEIQRMSTEDGPGLRTTVFFKGCSLKCAWCHNPESISLLPQIHWVSSRCIGCRTCLDTCPRNALSMTEEGILIDRGVCDGCGLCVPSCPYDARLMRRLLRYLRPYWWLVALAIAILAGLDSERHEEAAVRSAAGTSCRCCSCSRTPARTAASS